MHSNDDFAHIDLYVNDLYKFSFGYPINIPDALSQVKERIEKTKAHTEDIAQTLGALVDLTAERLITETIDDFTNPEKSQLVFLLCGFIMQLSEEKDDALEAGKDYTLRLEYTDDDMLIQMYETTQATTIH